MRKKISRMLICIFLVFSILLLTVGEGMAEESDLEAGDDDSDLVPLSEATAARIKSTGSTGADDTTSLKHAKEESTSHVDDTTDENFDLGLSDVKFKGSDLQLQSNYEKTKPLMPKIGLILVVAFIAFVLSLALAPLLGGAKAANGSTFKSHQMRQDGLVAIGTGPIVAFLVVIAFGFISIFVGWL